MEDSLLLKIRKVAQQITKSKSSVVLTGAGVSTESGIPDFRGRSGIWKKFNPMVYGNIDIMKRDPAVFWKMGKKLAPTLLKAKPNPGHIALAELEKLGIIKCIITQNIDGLHQMAGSKEVYEVHGSLRTFTCMICNTKYTQEDIIPQVLTQIPKCLNCGGFLKPDVVLFGESLPTDQIEKSRNATKKSKLILVAGSALEVFPVNMIPQTVLEQGGKLFIVNDEPTWFDDKAEIVIHEKTGIILPKIVEEVRKLI